MLSESYKLRIKKLAGILSENDVMTNDNFKKWFDGSKVVDKSGNPLMVHHGTSKKFSKFNFKNALQKIIWFTSNKTSIEAGEVGANGKGHIMDLYASIKKPAGWDEYEKYGLGQLQGMGYDGAILPDPDGTITGFVFNSNQLKSVANKGEWNPDNGNIFKENDSISEGINVYHGSDRKFDVFDINKVGSGDGKQLGGWGIYFSDSPEVSKRYVTKNGFLKPYEIKGKNYFDLDELLDPGDGESIIYSLERQGVSEDDLNQFRGDYIEQQVTNKQVYEWLTHVLGGEKQASLFLNGIGFSGNKFKDRIVTDATNYVVFDVGNILDSSNEEDFY